MRFVGPHHGDCMISRLEDEGTTRFTSLRVDREYMFGGLFYGVEGMRVGGTRRLRFAPHLAFKEEGVPGIVPANALLTVEVEVLGERTTG
jgi:FKBP-type peptidyl-prolyl cis-trans isomerase